MVQLDPFLDTVAEATQHISSSMGPKGISLSEPAALDPAPQGGKHIILAYCRGICRVVGKPPAVLGGVSVHDYRAPHGPLQTPRSPPSWGGRDLVTHDGELYNCSGGYRGLRDGVVVWVYVSRYEGVMHAMRLICQKHELEEGWGFLLIYAQDVFNEENWTSMLWDFWFEWPSGAWFNIKFYCHRSSLVIRGTEG